MGGKDGNNNSRGHASTLIGIALVGLGATFLLGQVFHVNLWAFFWPFFIIIPGLLFFVGMVLGGKPAGPLAIPGSIVTMVGLILLYQSVTGHWSSWAYIWALIFPTSVGIGLVINGTWSNVDQMVRSGMRWITAGVAIFLIGGLFFELLIFSHGGAGRIIFPLVLIGLGIYLATRRPRPAATTTTGVPPVVEVYTPPDSKPQPTQPAGPEFEPLDMTRARRKK